MQKYILRNKNRITFFSGVLISLAFISKLVFNEEYVSIIFLVVASIIGALPIFIQAYQALKVKVVSIDVLVTLAVIGAFVIKNYEESALVTFLFLFGAYLEKRTLNKTRRDIKKLTEMAPKTTHKLMDDGIFKEVDVDEVDVGDILMVKTGEKVPVDGTVKEGSASINEASITGEPIPQYKKDNSKVYAGTIIDNGTIRIIADKVFEDTSFGKIIELLEESQDSKSEQERFIDRFSKWYTPFVLIISIIVWVVSKNIELAITILVLGCPGALVIGVPVSNVAGIGNGAKNGILIKGSELIKDLSSLDTIIFDKTGTLTEGKPSVEKKIFYGDDIEDSLSYLSSIEHESDHPLANAVIKEIGEVNLFKVSDTKVFKGEGIVANINNREVVVGSLSIIDNMGVKLSEKQRFDALNIEKEGSSLVLTAVDGKLKILMGIKDKIRPGVKEDLIKIRELGIKNLVMLSGDNKGTVDAVSKELNLSKAFSNMLPEDKSNYVKELKKKGERVAFIGDGINDSPSLALADIGIAMGRGTDVAIETSDVVLMNSDLSKLPYAIGLAKAIYNNSRENIIIAVGVVIFLLFSLVYSEWMNMTIGMLVHEGSILMVILNGMRLINYKFNK